MKPENICNATIHALQKKMYVAAERLTKNQRQYAAILLAKNRYISSFVKDWVMLPLGYSTAPPIDGPAMEAVIGLANSKNNDIHRYDHSVVLQQITLLDALGQSADVLKAAAFLEEIAAILSEASALNISNQFASGSAEKAPSH